MEIRRPSKFLAVVPWDDAEVDADRILSEIRALVAAGEYLDELPGVAQPRRPSDGGVWYQKRGETGWRRMYRRGSPEHLQARAAGSIAPLPPLRPASPEAVAEAEAVIGYPLPPLLRRLYQEVVCFRCATGVAPSTPSSIAPRRKVRCGPGTRTRSPTIKYRKRSSANLAR